MIPLYWLLLSIALMIRDDEFSIYGEVAFDETDGWSENSINAIESTNGECPPEYTKLSAKYLGIHTICALPTGMYELDVCKKSTGKT